MDPRLRTFARRMRKEPTPAEQAMWRLLRNRRLAGFKFRRQHSIGPYIADYICAAALLVIELDGDSHVGRERQDNARDSYFRSLGLEVVRIWNTQVFEDQDAVVDAIYHLCSTRTAALPEHPRRTGVRRWGLNRAQAPSPGSPREPTSPPGERCSTPTAHRSTSTPPAAPDPEPAGSHLSPGGEVDARSASGEGAFLREQRP